MGSFASFRKCDLQIHSPRDPNWQSARCVGLGDDHKGSPATEQDVHESRKVWARAFVEHCEKIELQCVAITDHHEMVMTQYVMEELALRASAGRPADLWLFPAMEITAQHGCQAIVLFDADLGTEWHSQAQAALGISLPSISPLASVAKQPTPLSIPYPEIADRLDTHKELHGRYIVLPNVSAGKNSVLRQGFQEAFRTMRYVGGYLDSGQTADGHSTNKVRMSGNDPVWGDRFIYPITTSDGRSLSAIGANNAWIKLSAPKAEAMRQAFLAWQSRMRTEPPTYASAVIQSVSIIGAQPLEDMIVELSWELNSVIGGRGSGKSTLLEYIAFGIGRSCFDLPEKQFSGKERLVSLIQETLINQSAEVRAKVLLDGALFEVLRGPTSSYQPRLKYPNGNEEVISPQELRNLIPGYVYSQGELSELGSNTHAAKVSDLLAFVDSSFKSEAARLDALVATAKEKHVEALQQLLSLWRTEDEKRRLENKVSATRARIKALEATLPKLQDADQKVLDEHSRFVVVSEQVEQAVEDIAGAADTFEQLRESLKSVQRIEEASELPEMANVAKA